MRAAKTFVELCESEQTVERVHRVTAELFGSLGATGIGHGSNKAVVLGLMGFDPETVDVHRADDIVQEAADSHVLRFGNVKDVAFHYTQDVLLHLRKTLPAHPNGMTFSAFDEHNNLLTQGTYYSVGGGFVVDEQTMQGDTLVVDDVQVAYPFSTGKELLDVCSRTGMTIAEVMAANELAWRTEAETRAALLNIWRVMQECVENGCNREESVLPGGLQVGRRAPKLRATLEQQALTDSGDGLREIEWVNLFALAVNEENASGGRIVTAPTNGAAGIIPAVLHYYARFVPGASDDGIVEFLLTAAAVGILFKLNASISGAEVGCQGEVGSACSMAAAGLAAVLGGTPEQIENAAEIGIEHNLGLTCDPVGGLVQIPCIERNAIASVKAINAARLAQYGDGSHMVSLDSAIKTMRDTGADMKVKYKETSRGGLAVNYVEC